MSFLSKDNIPLISLIIPVYNVKMYLCECLNSAIMQTYKNLEIIIVDDGSTDGCSTFCDEYERIDSRVTVFHTSHRGLSAARNMGLDHISPASKYIIFLDSDDWMYNDTIQKLYEEAEAHQADLVSCNYFEEKPKGRRIVYPLYNKLVLENDRIISSYINDHYIGHNAWNKLYKRCLFDDIRYPDGMIFEDVYTTCSIIIKTKKVVVLPEPLVHYRVREKSLSRDFSAKCLVDYWKANYRKYIVLSHNVNNIEINPLIGDCLLAINRMWRGYGGLKSIEKKKINVIIYHMKIFASKHCQSVLQGNYSILHKITCIIAKTNNPLLMLIYNRIYRLYYYLKKHFFSMYKQ